MLMITAGTPSVDWHLCLVWDRFNTGRCEDLSTVAPGTMTPTIVSNKRALLTLLINSWIESYNGYMIKLEDEGPGGGIGLICYSLKAFYKYT